jgi:GNAT superfamily N-acetyltransferase
MRFTADWHEDLALAGGVRIRLRLIRPDDKDRIREGLMKLSPESRYLRFFTAKVAFTEAELSYLTELDGYDHLAIGAVVLDADDREGDPVGVARFVRLPDDPAAAEPAVVVVDAMQNKGIGRVLMQRLVDAALERDVQRFHSEFLADNRAIRELFTSLSPYTVIRGAGPVMIAEFPLRPPAALVPAAHEPSPHADLLRWLRLAASSAVALRTRFQALFHPRALLDAWKRLRGT